MIVCCVRTLKCRFCCLLFLNASQTREPLYFHFPRALLSPSTSLRWRRQVCRVILRESCVSDLFRFARLAVVRPAVEKAIGVVDNPLDAGFNMPGM